MTGSFREETRQEPKSNLENKSLKNVAKEFIFVIFVSDLGALDKIMAS
jgi:hypothetical protein